MLDFADIYDLYAVDIYRFALWLTGDRSEAEDITSETFVRAWGRNSSIRTETLKAYLFTIARNLFLESKRKSKDYVSLKDVYPDPASAQDTIVESKNKLLKVQNILKTLPEIDRVAFILRVQHELPYAEIARILDLSLAATKVKIYRIRQKLIRLCSAEEV